MLVKTSIASPFRDQRPFLAKQYPTSKGIMPTKQIPPPATLTGYSMGYCADESKAALPSHTRKQIMPPAPTADMAAAIADVFTEQCFFTVFGNRKQNSADTVRATPAAIRQIGQPFNRLKTINW